MGKNLLLKLEHYKCPSWNILYAGRHWSVRAEMAEYAHQSVKEALQNVKWQPYTEKVKIVVTAYLKRQIDPSNVCEKMIEDGLKLCGVIKDDSPKYVESVTTKVIKSKRDYTEIEIYESSH